MDKTRNFDDITQDLCKQNNAGFSDVESLSRFICNEMG